MRNPGNTCITYYRNGGTGNLVAEAPVAHLSVVILSSEDMHEAVYRFNDLSALGCFLKWRFKQGI